MNAKFFHTLLSCVRMEIEEEGSVLKYMTKSETEEQRSSLLIMTQRHSIILLIQLSQTSVESGYEVVRSLRFKVLRTIQTVYINEGEFPEW